jgi:hypothetical protein
MTTTGTTMHVDRELTQRLMRSFAPPVALPEQLRNELVSTYSARLYGAPGRVSLDTLRIIWPALLGSAARAALRGTVLCSIPVHSLLRNESSLLARTQRRFAHHTYPFLPMRNFFINTNAILVHQPARAEHQPHTAGRAHDSSSCKAKSVRTRPQLNSVPAKTSCCTVADLEISHCFFGSWAEGIHHGALSPARITVLMGYWSVPASDCPVLIVTRPRRYSDVGMGRAGIGPVGEHWPRIPCGARSQGGGPSQTSHKNEPRLTPGTRVAGEIPS